MSNAASQETTTPLLATKLNIPPLRPNLVRRPRLVERLNQGLDLGHSLSLVSSPAGFGKTTVVSEWIDQLRSPNVTSGEKEVGIAWISLDEADNDPSRFLVYLVAALSQIPTIETAIGAGMLSLRQSHRPPPVEEILISLINDISAIGHRIILVFDDYHLIDAPQIDDALAFILERRPPQLHLVIATRTDPNLPIARYRARGHLTELRAVDLRFSSSEVAAFLNQAMELSLSPEAIATLENRTEGWIVGLQLAAVSMQGRQDNDAFIESFAGTHHFVMDYLVEDVLEQQPENVRAFLLRTAILGRLTASLCEALTDEEDGQAMLELIERANLFLVSLDEERCWYRYHRLFSDLLRKQVRQRRPEWMSELHQRACEWYRKNGHADQAIEHALRGADFERAADLLEEHIEAFWGHGENSRLQRWLNELPEKILFARPAIAVFQARYQCTGGRLDASRRTLAAVARRLEAGPSHPAAPASTTLTDGEQIRLQGRVATTRALICSYNGDVAGIIQHANQALVQLPAADLTWRSVNAILLGNAHGFLGDMTAAYAARSEALRACEAAGDIYFIILANLELAITLREQGKLRQTVEICRQQLQIATENGLSQSRLVGWLLAVWGETLAELDDLDEALDRAQQGFELTRRSGELQMVGWSFMCLARILLSRGDMNGLYTTIRTMETLAREFQLPPWIEGQKAAWQARLWLAQGQVPAAARWAEKLDFDLGEPDTPPVEIGFFPLLDYIVLARIRIAQGQYDEASTLLPHLLRVAEAGGRNCRAIEIRVLQALALHAQGESKHALSVLEAAVAIAEPEGFVRTFVDEGPPMASMLQHTLSRDGSANYVQRLLAAFGGEKQVQIEERFDDGRSALVEPLSNRELEVLQLIAEGLTNREIAERLYLSLNTVKSHSRNIYGKLGVHSRTQAVARAGELAILPPL